MTGPTVVCRSGTYDRPMPIERHPISQLAQWMRAARHGVVFTGAGMSTESGIPDFRSPGGVWSRMQPIEFDDFLHSPEARHESWRRVFSGERGWTGKQPNAGHAVIADWVRSGRVAHVITQNVDNLHQISGVPDGQVTELHGNAGYARCLDCGERAELEDLRTEFERTGQVRSREACGGLLKLATISFGQTMPEAAMARAEQQTLACDLFLAIGSSLQVYPAAGFPEMAKAHGAKLAILNRETTGLDDIADLVIHAEIGVTLVAVANLLNGAKP